MKSSPDIRPLITVLEEAFRRKAWHGPNLRGSFRGLTAREAAWRPSKAGHNIWEYMLHAAYWKYAIRRRITGEKRGSFPVQGSNFFARPVSTAEKAWRNDIRILENEHVLLVQAVRMRLPGLLARLPAARRAAVIRTIHGIAFHDVYHAGQIRLLRRMVEARQ